MKNPVPSAFLAMALAAVASAQTTDAIQRLRLDPMTVVRIPVALDRLTTVRLPSPPADIESALVGTEPHPDALFVIAVQPDSPTFSLRALVPHTNTTLNVSYKGQTYVFELFESRQPWLSVIFEDQREPAGPGPQGNSRAMAPARLLGILDTAKAYGLLRQQHPEAVAGIEVVRPSTLRDYGPYTIRTEEVFRFDREDTLVFRIAISNKTSVPIQFLPESLMVRVGTRCFFQSLAEASGAVAPNTVVPVYFAVTGNSDGSRSALSAKNDFMILLHRLEADPGSASKTAPPTPPQTAAPSPPRTGAPSPPPSNPVAPLVRLGTPAPAAVPKPVNLALPMYQEPAAQFPVLPAPQVWVAPRSSNRRSGGYVQAVPFAYGAPGDVPSVAQTAIPTSYPVFYPSPPRQPPARVDRPDYRSSGGIRLRIHLGF
jgi:hypothetical protein